MVITLIKEDKKCLEMTFHSPIWSCWQRMVVEGRTFFLTEYSWGDRPYWKYNKYVHKYALFLIASKVTVPFFCKIRESQGLVNYWALPCFFSKCSMCTASYGSVKGLHWWHHNRFLRKRLLKVWESGQSTILVWIAIQKSIFKMKIQFLCQFLCQILQATYK